MKPFDRHLNCPWCHKGEVLANGLADVEVSAQCPKCERFFTGNLKTLETKKSKACKRAS